MSAELQSFLNLARARIDSALERYLPQPPACPPLLSEAMRYSLFAGGKRFRPTLTLSVADACARRLRMSSELAQDAALPAACAIELIHTYSLIHDDLPAMDNDVLRRGRPTLHVVYGDGIAILAGDALQAEAFSLMAREPSDDSVDDARAAALAQRKGRTIAAIAHAAGAVGMVGGQTIDLQAAGQVAGHAIDLDADSLRMMHSRKTGAIIRASGTAGAIMAGADDAIVHAVDRYAAELGLAFQIVDDILDVEGAPAELGKTSGKDAADGKPTYASLFGVERSRQMARDCVDRAREALTGAGMTAGWLAAIAEWVVGRNR